MQRRCNADAFQVLRANACNSSLLWLFAPDKALTWKVFYYVHRLLIAGNGDYDECRVGIVPYWPLYRYECDILLHFRYGVSVGFPTSLLGIPSFSLPRLRLWQGLTFINPRQTDCIGVFYSAESRRTQLFGYHATWLLLMLHDLYLFRLHIHHICVLVRRVLFYPCAFHI